MLSLLTKMGAENILIIVFVWHTRLPGHFSNEVYKMVLDRTKDFVSTLHSKVFEAEQMIIDRLGGVDGKIT